MAKEETVTIPRDEWEAMKTKMAEITAASLRGIGIDPKIAARQDLKYQLVQFKKNYTRASLPSEIQKGAIVIEGYSGTGGQVVQMRVDEVKRLMKEQPSLLNIDEKEFLPMDRMVGGKKKPVSVKDLIAAAPKVG